MRKRRPTSDEIVRTVINKMFEIAGHDVTYDDIKDRKDSWWTDWTMTVEQDKEWKAWMINYFRKECRRLPNIATREADMMSFKWGLKFDKV